MVIKSHISGLHVAYTERGGKLLNPLPYPGQSCGRAQGSLYSYQKKRIADAVAYLQSIATDDCRPLIFVATSPGFVDRANEPRFISKLVHNLRNGYRMRNYVWVREFTGAGFPHFHFVANIPLPKKAVYKINGGQRVPFDPVKLSVYWSGLFGSEAKNSIRVGSKPNKHGRRMLYLSNNRRKAWYLAKYIGKSRSDDEKRTRARIKAFHMDEVTSSAIEPNLFRSKYITETRAVSTWNVQARKFENKYFDISTGERVFESETGELLVAASVDWQYVGHDCWTGFKKTN